MVNNIKEKNFLTKKNVFFCNNYPLKCNDNNWIIRELNGNVKVVFLQILHFPYHII